MSRILCLKPIFVKIELKHILFVQMTVQRNQSQRGISIELPELLRLLKLSRLVILINIEMMIINN